VLGLPRDFSKSLIDKAAKLTPADIQAVAQKYLDEKNLYNMTLLPRRRLRLFRAVWLGRPSASGGEEASRTARFFAATGWALAVRVVPRMRQRRQFGAGHNG